MSIEVVTKYNKNYIIDDFKLSRKELESPTMTLFVFDGYYRGELICNLGGYNENKFYLICKTIKQMDNLLKKSKMSKDKIKYSMPENIYENIKITEII